ncbi:hypothetical protein CU098_013745, partial [Rhizopus stolonifer]
MTRDLKALPTYDQLPIDPKYPPKTAWGLWGEDDDYGTLNLLTEERVAKASKCICRGAIFPLNWKLESPNPPLYGRTEIPHTYKSLYPGDLAYDDILTLNTQASTQWDGLRHVAHLPSGLYYNGIKPSDIAKGSAQANGRLGIAGRAVLLDYGRWAAKHKPDFDPFEKIEIPVEELDQVAAEQGVTFETGDILLLRTGCIEAYERYGEKVADKIKDLNNPDAAGVKSGEETHKWLWNHHFATVASDNIAFEAYPVSDWTTSC